MENVTFTIVVAPGTRYRPDAGETELEKSFSAAAKGEAFVTYGGYSVLTDGRVYRIENADDVLIDVFDGGETREGAVLTAVFVKTVSRVKAAEYIAELENGIGEYPEEL